MTDIKLIPPNRDTLTLRVLGPDSENFCSPETSSQSHNTSRSSSGYFSNAPTPSPVNGGSGNRFVRSESKLNTVLEQLPDDGQNQSERIDNDQVVRDLSNLSLEDELSHPPISCQDQSRSPVCIYPPQCIQYTYNLKWSKFLPTLSCLCTHNMTYSLQTSPEITLSEIVKEVISIFHNKFITMA